MDAAFEWLVAQSPQHGPLWYNDLIDAVLSLDELAQRCPLAPENGTSVEEIRQLLHGGKRHAYRILFTIRGPNVMVLHVRHASRNYLEN